MYRSRDEGTVPPNDPKPVKLDSPLFVCDIHIEISLSRRLISSSSSFELCPASASFDFILDRDSSFDEFPAENPSD